MVPASGTAFTASSQSSLAAPLSPGLHPGLHSPGTQVHRNTSLNRSTPSCHSQEHPIRYDAASASNASVDGLGESASSDGHSRDDSGELMECPVCLNEKIKDCFPEIQTCHHRCCSKCLKQYFKIEIMESRVSIACPECSELFHPNDIRAVVEDDSLMQKYEDFMLRRVLAMDSDTRWCPAPDCGYAVIATGCAGCPKLKCEREGCDTCFCYHCKQYWHPHQTCDAARAERSPNIRSASVSYSQGSGGQNEIKPCPRCGAFIVKMNDGSCNHMTCAVCGAGFCWLCMKEVSDLHYLSPSGCTFWGRKPWSRKKKILWQLGTLVGAPVGITLVAGIAVPAMIIGIPIWVGRKIHFRYELASKHKRHLAFVGGVTASVFAAPIIASIVVGIGVPILLAYVYGVVPISLCRSGGCGVTTTNSGGVRFEFDEENDTNTQGPYIYGGDSHSLETAPNVANPSIAPSIGDTSLGMTNSLSASGSHMDRAGVLRDDSDRDSSSHRAIAGTSINGSLCSASYSTQHHKLEVHADISEHGILSEKSSMGGESYNMSLNDDASTKALAGSIISPKDKDGVSLCSRHFDGATAAPLVYPEEVEEAAGACSSGQQRHGSSSCPTSPNLRKASPAPSEDKNSRGKKCTRFMDQVSEIEASKCDSKSVGSILSQSNPPAHSEDSVNISIAPAPTFSTLSLASAPPVTLPPVLNSCSSLACHEERAVIADPCLRMKAESTSVLMDGADSRRCEMGGSHQQQGSCRFKDKDGQNARSWLGSKKNGKSSDKEHRSQPVNLSDISEMKGMPCHHTAGCDNLLAVLDASCEHVFLDKSGHTRTRSTSASSSSSSIEASSDLPPRHCSSLRKCYPSTNGEVQCAGGLNEHFHSDYGLDRVREEAVSSDSCSHLSRMSRQREWCDSDRCLIHGSKMSKLSVCSPISEDNICDGDDDHKELSSPREAHINEGVASKDLAYTCVSLGTSHPINSAILPEVEAPTETGQAFCSASLKFETEDMACCSSGIDHPEVQDITNIYSLSAVPSLKKSILASSNVQGDNVDEISSTLQQSSSSCRQERGKTEGTVQEAKTEDIPSIQGVITSTDVQQNIYVSERVPSNNAGHRNAIIHNTDVHNHCQADGYQSSVL